MYKVTIPMRLPGFNEFLEACKIQHGKWNKGNAIKQEVQGEIIYYLRKLPKFEKPIRLSFVWITPKNDRRDPDNICFAKKFILDALQKAGKLINDSKKYITGGFVDAFETAEKYEVIVKIEEIKAFELKKEE